LRFFERASDFLRRRSAADRLDPVSWILEPEAATAPSPQLDL
jgi:hypothetical protein